MEREPAQGRHCPRHVLLATLAAGLVACSVAADTARVGAPAEGEQVHTTTQRVTLVNLLTAALLLVPAPPLHGGALLAALVPPLDVRAGRWDRLRRTDTTPWLLAILALVVAWHTVTR